MVPLACSGSSPNEGGSDEGGVTTNASSSTDGPDTADSADTLETAESGDGSGDDSSVVEAAFATAQAEHPGADPASDMHDSELRKFGCPSPAQRASWRAVAMRELIHPCAARLLAMSSVSARVHV
jgi:hypothetical protein